MLARSTKGSVGFRGGSCNKGKETVQHTQAGCVPSLQKLAHANQEEVAEEVRNLVKVQEWDRLEWTELGGTGELGQLRRGGGQMIKGRTEELSAAGLCLLFLGFNIQDFKEFKKSL